eukprot:jgi/Chrpa1/16420/Chrysochromulina_OHIO_Genome00023451-RA
MEAVHAHKIIHLDLKPENVLIGPLDVPWITDFGLSTSANMTSMSQSTVGGRGTLPFKAPELFVHPPHVGPEADVYAFSILAWIVVCGEQPYAKMLAAATSLPQAVAQGVRPKLANPNEEWQDKTIGPMVRLIEGCWHAEYTQRPTFGSDSASLDGSHEEGGEGSKAAGSGVVARLEKMEYSLSKGYEMEASQLALATRLISTESEAETLGVALVQIGAAQGDARTTAAEMSELAEEKAALETSQGLLRQHAFALLSQMPGGTGGELASALSVMLQQQSDMFRQAMLELSESVERSLIRLAEGELDCPRLFVLLPMEKSSSKLMQLVKREFVKDKYRLVFLDPVTGCAVRCGPEGNGYKLEMPKKWLVENRKIISAGLRIVKMTAAAGCVAGLPLEAVMGLPSQAVSKAEVEAVKMFERVYSGSVLFGDDALGDDASSTSSSASPSAAKAVKAATGRAYKQLRKMLKEQCEDEYLVHCEMTKEKARDGSIEFVSAGSKERFLHFGQQALIWNDETLKQKAAAKAAALKEVEVMAAAPTDKAKAASLRMKVGHDLHAWKSTLGTDCVNEIVPGLFLGDCTAAERPPGSVRRIINMTQSAGFHEGRLKYLHIDIDDNDDAPILKFVDRANAFLDEGLRSSEHVLVHCNSGMSRSATLVIAFLMSQRGMSLAEAYETTRSARPVILPNRGFFGALQRHELALGRPASMSLEDAEVERLAHPCQGHLRVRARDVLRAKGGDYQKALEALCRERDTLVGSPMGEDDEHAPERALHEMQISAALDLLTAKVAGLMHAMGQAPPMAMPNLEAGGFPTAGMAGGLPTAGMAALMAELYSLREASAVASRASHATPPPGALPAPSPAGSSWGGIPMVASPIGWVKHRLGFGI